MIIKNNMKFEAELERDELNVVRDCILILNNIREELVTNECNLIYWQKETKDRTEKGAVTYNGLEQAIDYLYSVFDMYAIGYQSKLSKNNTMLYLETIKKDKDDVQ